MHNRKGWILFRKEHTSSLSENFREELSKQLGKIFSERFLAGESFEDVKFFLEVGRDGVSLKEKGGYVFTTAHILTPNAQKIPLTICWRSSESDNLLELHKEEKQDNTVFLFCDDFPVYEISKYLLPRKIILPDESGLEFPIYGYLYSFPDIRMMIYFDGLVTEKDIEYIDSIVNTLFSTEDVYTDVTKENENRVIINFDYYLDETSYTKKATEKKVSDLLGSIKKISKPFNNITKVSIF